MLGLANLVKYRKTTLFFVLISCVLYLSFAYDLVRTDASKLLLLYIALFASAFMIIKTTGFYFRIIVVAAILFRVLFLFATPNLSQDFYRFIWDGRMLLEGFNPYLHTVESFISNSQFPVAQAQELYEGMGKLNASHFTNYPPINQLCFAIAALFSGNSILGSVIVMRILIIAADLGALYFGKKLLEHLHLPSLNIGWYILNPFIIIELTGNLHFEGVMVFFLVWSLYLIAKGRWLLAAIVFGLSVSTKLIPLMFLPLFYQWFTTNKQFSFKSNVRRLISFYAVVGLTIVFTFSPFYNSQFISNYSQTVGLWFNNFEFNASIYYLAREVGFWLTGYNEIAIIGKILPAIVFIFILTIAFLRTNTPYKKLITAMLMAITIYLFLSTTVHPWYIAMPLFLSIFTRYKFPIVWSLAIILSYLAYLNIGSADKSENLWIIAIEYTIVFSFFLYEVFKRKTQSNPLLQD